MNNEQRFKNYRRRKARTVFTDQQLIELEKRFEGQKYLSTPERYELANLLNLSEAQVISIYQYSNHEINLNYCLICDL